MKRAFGSRHRSCAAALMLLGSVACTVHPRPSPERQRLQSEIQRLERDNGAYEEKLRAAQNDPGLRVRLTSDRELLKSRLERLREQLEALPPPE